MGQPSYADERQLRIADAICARSPKLEGMYRRALRELSSEPAPGDEVARVSTICHCLRELMTGLPSAMSDVDIPRPDPSASALTSQLPDMLSRRPVDFGLDADSVPVPRKIARKLGALVAAATQEQGRNSRLAAALVTGGDDTKHPAIQQWRDAYKFFMGWTHLDRNHERQRELPKDEEILLALRVVEDVIEVRSTVFFENVAAIKDLLADINQLDGEGA